MIEVHVAELRPVDEQEKEVLPMLTETHARSVRQQLSVHALLTVSASFVLVARSVIEGVVLHSTTLELDGEPMKVPVRLLGFDAVLVVFRDERSTDPQLRASFIGLIFAKIEYEARTQWSRKRGVSGDGMLWLVLSEKSKTSHRCKQSKHTQA